MPRRHRERLADEIAWPGDIEERATTVVLSGGILGLVGPRGTGKTQLAVKIAWRCVFDCGWSCLYTRADDLFEAVKREFDEGSTGSNVRRLARLGLLIIDEAQERKVDSQFERQTLGRILDKRYAEMLPTILISNETPAEFAANVGASVVSRMQEGGALLVLDGPSFRGASASCGFARNVELIDEQHHRT